MSPSRPLAALVAATAGLALATAGASPSAEAATRAVPHAAHANGHLWFDESYNGDLGYVERAGGTPHLLRVGSDPSVSPDGTRILYDGTNGLRMVNADGTGDHIVAVDGSQGDWNPGGTRIAFVRGDDVWTADADGTHAADLTDTSDASESTPAWSPDGVTIAYTTDACTAQGGGTCVYSEHVDGTDVTNLTSETAFDCNGNTFAQDVVSARPAWSPDGSQIAFRGFGGCVSGGGNTDIWVMDADGSDKVDVTPDQDSADDYPTWSPDGTAIAFLSDRASTDGHPQLFTVQATGGTVTQVPISWPHAVEYPGHPDWAVAVASRASALPLSASTTSVAKKGAVTLSARLLPAYLGQAVTFQQQKPGATAWTTLAPVARTSATGAVAHVVHPTATLRYRAVYAGSPALGLRSVVSRTITVKVH